MYLNTKLCSHMVLNLEVKIPKNSSTKLFCGKRSLMVLNLSP